jgi:hypothetical protein
MFGKILAGAAGAVIAIGLAAPASAAPVKPAPQPSPPAFLAAAHAAGVTGADPAMLEDGYSACNRLWVRHMSGTQVAASLIHDHPALTTGEAADFVLDAYHNLCPVPGDTVDYWAYSTS